MSFICYNYNFLVFAILISNLVVLSALNPIHRMVWLIIVFVQGSFIFQLLDFLFIGLTYIIVYVGAIAILFLFVIMMVQIHNITETNLQLPLNNDNVIGNLNTYANTITYESTTSNLNQDKRGTNYLNLSTLWFPVLQILIVSSLFFINTSNSFAIYYYTSWFELYKNFTDIETLANMIYIAYPTALVFLAILLWSVLIGVIKITMANITENY